ncbi:4Fe-4S binding protein [Verminephrobacter eiseniae]|uniref:4Fe-4S binding protein n=1 Tax=Verminephrobacter eiseniae TaxID=364317 RepID=UPI002238E58E|nr:4Fe-4S binding protein [Verminephrobacter eiseniae]MCW5237705.1 4Fe-4S binding protein [Verminephrobacter eiseniae]
MNSMHSTAWSAAGDWLQAHGLALRRLQWVVVLAYAVLLVVPALLPLPDETAHIWSNLTVFAQFVFWGIWWPFVLLSMILVGRAWCGILCPEGALAEWASGKGRNRAIARWMRWKGWPFTAFAVTTIYGQMISVYQYPKAVLLVLGGSTAAAMAVGYLYGREKRVWCKYLCPVNGVFGLLSKLAPLHFAVDVGAWRRSYGKPIRIHAVNCAPLVALRHMEGASDCHMCGRCSGHRQAIALTARSPNEEVVQLGARLANGWQTVLILFGLLGIAIGAFQWSANPHFVVIKQWIAQWLVEHDILWPLHDDTPWWLLTNYPEQRDVFSWLDGGLVVGYILGVGAAMGAVLALILAGTCRIWGPWKTQRFHHLAQALIPVAGCGVFLGLSALTIQLLKADGVPVHWANGVRLVLLAAANLWSLCLAHGIAQQYSPSPLLRGLGLAAFGMALAWVDYAWILMFWLWP